MSLFRRRFINFNCYVTGHKYVSSLLPTAKVHKIPEQNKVYTFTKEIQAMIDMDLLAVRGGSLLRPVCTSLM